jgi:response regulator RpfG family c-di-GMP phosphodiesterase
MALTLGLIVAGILIAGTLLTRPISRLGAAVRRIATGDLDHRVEVRSRDELGHLAHDVNMMARDLKKRTDQIAKARSRSREAMIFAMARLAESRDDDTGKHLERICKYSEILAGAVAKDDPSLDEEWVHTVAITAALHDIGKVGIPDSVLKKPGKLTDEERARMQRHTTIGGDTLLDVRREWSEDDFLRTAAEIALSHHEHWDGKGYPYGLSGEDISLPARIVAVADVYDALTSKRVYKPPMPHDEAVALIVKGSGKQFDPKVIAVFRTVEHQFREVSQGQLSV